LSSSTTRRPPSFDRLSATPPPEATGIELSELRQDRSADFSPLAAVLVGRERGGLKSALLNSMPVLSEAPEEGSLMSDALAEFPPWRG